MTLASAGSPPAGFRQFDCGFETMTHCAYDFFLQLRKFTWDSLLVEVRTRAGGRPRHCASRLHGIMCRILRMRPARGLLGVDRCLLSTPARAPGFNACMPWAAGAASKLRGCFAINDFDLVDLRSVLILELI